VLSSFFSLLRDPLRVHKSAGFIAWEVGLRSDDDDDDEDFRMSFSIHLEFFPLTASR